MSLDLYKKKRDFKSTPEPDSNEKIKKSVLTFVVQRHEATNLHYDLRLQMEGVLKSWAIPKGPSMIAGERRLAVMVEDHPLSYGEFYGQIPEGNYGAGNVEIWDEGIYLPLEETDDAESFLLNQLEKGKLNFVIHGNYLKGAFSLVRINSTKKKNEWLLIKKKDKYALTNFNIEESQSIKSTANSSLEQTMSNDNYIDYLIYNDAATLVYMANLGCIEINPWHSTYLAPDVPSYIVLDYRLPAVTSIERSVSKRKDKVYIDYLQNNKGQTISSAYSIRPRPLATVSTPLDWKEVNYNLTPQMFTIKNIPDRLNAMGDLWAPVLKKGIVLAKAMKALDKLQNNGIR